MRLRKFSGAAMALAALAALASPTTRAAESCPAGQVEGKRVTIDVKGSGPDVVLIPGLSSPRAVWDGTAAQLKDRHRLHIVQIRGFGDAAGINAEGPVLEPVMREVADYIDDCITDAGRAAPAIIGHSMGGLTGLMIAVRAPSEVGKLMIVDALPFIGTLFAPGATIASVKPQAAQMADMMRAQHGRAVPPPVIADPGIDSPLGRMSNTAAGRIKIAEWARVSDARVTAQVFYDVMTTDMRGELGAVLAPVTLLYAQDDGALPAEAAKAAFEPHYAGVANFTAHMVPGSRHFIMLDQPQAFAEAVDAFLRD